MDEIEILITQLGCRWIIGGKKPREDAITKLVEIGEPAVPALIKKLKELNLLQQKRFMTLDDIEGSNRNIHSGIWSVLVNMGLAAVPSLIEALNDGLGKMRMDAFRILKKVLDNCVTIEEVNGFERKLREGMVHLNKGKVGGIKVTTADIDVARLGLAAADRKNSLASKRDILLDDISKPPKKGGVYQSIRTERMRNG